MNLRRFLIALCGLLAGSTAALAHPHVWVAARSEVVFDAEGRILGLRNAWEFDEMYSACAG
jgi:ABC-type uncharacterized transport system substrate-binding protein